MGRRQIASTTIRVYPRTKIALLKRAKEDRRTIAEIVDGLLSLPFNTPNTK